MRARPGAGSAAPARGATAGAPRPARWHRAGCAGRRLGRVPLPRHEVSHERKGQRRRGRSAGWPARGADAPAGRHREGPVRPGRPAAGAVEQRGGVAGHRHGPQQEGVEDERRVALGHRAQRPDDQQEQPKRGLALLRRQPLSRLQHRGPGRVAGVVADEGLAVRGDALGLGHDVEVAAGVELQVDVAEGLDRRAELGAGTANALGYGPDPAVLLGEERDDAVGLAELLHAKDHAFVAVEAHASTLALKADTRRSPRMARWSSDDGDRAHQHRPRAAGPAGGRCPRSHPRAGSATGPRPCWSWEPRWPSRCPS